MVKAESDRSLAVSALGSKGPARQRLAAAAPVFGNARLADAQGYDAAHNRAVGVEVAEAERGVPHRAFEIVEIRAGAPDRKGNRILAGNIAAIAQNCRRL